MTDIAIRVENLSKLYHIGRARERHDTPSATNLRFALRASLRDAVADALQRLTFKRSNDEHI
jgi:hypothetical protein